MNNLQHALLKAGLVEKEKLEAILRSEKQAEKRAKEEKLKEIERKEQDEKPHNFLDRSPENDYS